MESETDDLDWLAGCCRAAVELHGTDMGAVRTYLTSRLDDLPDDARARLELVARGSSGLGDRPARATSDLEPLAC